MCLQLRVYKQRYNQALELVKNGRKQLDKGLQMLQMSAGGLVADRAQAGGEGIYPGEVAFGVGQLYRSAVDRVYGITLHACNPRLSRGRRRSMQPKWWVTAHGHAACQHPPASTHNLL